MRALAVLIALAGCASTRVPGPTAELRLVNPSAWAADDVQRIRNGAAVWTQLGFRFSVENESDLPLCPHDWAKRGIVECRIVIGVVRDERLMERYRVSGTADRATDTITVDARYVGWLLTAVIAHELGHILLNTARHTQTGVMRPDGDEWEPNAADRALACETVSRGCN